MGGILAGIGQMAHEENLLTMQRNIERQRNLAEHFNALAQDQRYTPEQQQEFQTRALHIITEKDPERALKKHAGAYEEIVSRPRKTQGAPATMPPKMLTAPAQQPPQTAMPPPPPRAENLGQGPSPEIPPAIAEAIAPPPVQPPPSTGMLSPQELAYQRGQAQAAELTPQLEAQLSTQAKFTGLSHTHLEELGRHLGLTGIQLAQFVEGRGVTPVMPKPLAGTVPGSALIAGGIQADSLGNPVEKETQYHAMTNPQNPSEIVGAFPASERAQWGGRVWYKDADTGEFAMAIYNQQGNKILNVIKGVLPPPGYLEHTIQTVSFVPQADGSTIAVPKPTTRRPVLPSSGGPKTGNIPSAEGRPATATTRPPPPPTGESGVKSAIQAEPQPAAKGTRGYQGGPVKAGTVVGGRPLPELSRERMDASKAAFDNTIDLVHNILPKLNVLNSLISAGKIAMAVSPTSKLLQVTSRLNDMSPEEVQVAADFQSLAEHINTLRGPLGATGFRGPEAFGALQAQRGNLLANPAITKRVLETSMKALLGQKSAIQREFARTGTHTMELTRDIAEQYYDAAGGNPESARKLAERDGWKVK